MQAVGAYTDTIARGVRFERHIALHEGTMVIVDRLSSGEPHTYDLAHHGFGQIQTDVEMRPISRLGGAKMYDLPEDVKRGTVRRGLHHRYVRVAA